jgi:hypothetical protein
MWLYYCIAAQTKSSFMPLFWSYSFLRDKGVFFLVHFFLVHTRQNAGKFARLYPVYSGFARGVNL